MEKIKLILLLLFISFYCLGQGTNYPKLYNNKQKLYLITEYQLKTTIKMGYKIDMCEEKLELCQNSNKIKLEKINLLQQNFANCDYKISKLEMILDEKDKQINLRDKIIGEQKKELRKQKAKKIVAGVVGGSIGLIGGVAAGSYIFKK